MMPQATLPTLQKRPGAVRRFARLIRFANWLQALPRKLTPPPFQLMQINTGLWHARALHAAVVLDLATHLGDGACTTRELAAQTDAQADGIGRLLRLLSALGVFQEATPPGEKAPRTEATRTWSNNAASHWLRSDRSESLRDLILFQQDEALVEPWIRHLLPSLRGEAEENGAGHPPSPFERCHGRPLFDWLGDHPHLDARFAAAMDRVDALAGEAFATDFDWSRFRRIIDLGGSRGAKSLAILRHHPGLSALIVDRPTVVAEAQAHWAAHPAPDSERLHFQAGDFFQGVPPAEPGDVYLLAAIFHALDDQESRTLLTHLAQARALAVTGDTPAPIVVLDLLLPEQGCGLAEATLDMQMWATTRGRERTRREWETLLAPTGLDIREEIGLCSLARMLVIG